MAKFKKLHEFGLPKHESLGTHRVLLKTPQSMAEKLADSKKQLSLMMFME